MFSVFRLWSLFLIIFELKFGFYTSKSPPGTPPHSWKPKKIKIGERLAKVVVAVVAVSVLVTALGQVAVVVVPVLPLAPLVVVPLLLVH